MTTRLAGPPPPVGSVRGPATAPIVTTPGNRIRSTGGGTAIGVYGPPSSRFDSFAPAGGVPPPPPRDFGRRNSFTGSGRFDSRYDRDLDRDLDFRRERALDYVDNINDRDRFNSQRRRSISGVDDYGTNRRTRSTAFSDFDRQDSMSSRRNDTRNSRFTTSNARPNTARGAGHSGYGNYRPGQSGYTGAGGRVLPYGHTSNLRAGSYREYADNAYRFFDALPRILEGKWTRVETKDQVLVSRALFPGFDLYCWRGATTVPLPAHAVYESLRGPEGIREYDQFCKTSSLIEELDPHTLIYHVGYNANSMLASDRDFVLYESAIENPDGSFAIVTFSIRHNSVPETTQYVRGDIVLSAYVIKPARNDNLQCHLISLVQLDPKGWLPTWMGNNMSQERVQKLGAVRRWLERRGMNYTKRGRGGISARPGYDSYGAPTGAMSSQRGRSGRYDTNSTRFDSRLDNSRFNSNRYDSRGGGYNDRYDSRGGGYNDRYDSRGGGYNDRYDSRGGGYNDRYDPNYGVGARDYERNRSSLAYGRPSTSSGFGYDSYGSHRNSSAGHSNWW